MKLGVLGLLLDLLAFCLEAAPCLTGVTSFYFFLNLILYLSLVTLAFFQNYFSFSLYWCFLPIKKANFFGCKCTFKSLVTHGFLFAHTLIDLALITVSSQNLIYDVAVSTISARSLVFSKYIQSSHFKTTTGFHYIVMTP